MRLGVRVWAVAWLATGCAVLAAGAGMIDKKTPKSDEDAAAGNLGQVKRIFVGALTGGAGADAMRDLIISGINGLQEFVITENEEKADAVLKGAADDKVFTDTFDSQEGISAHGNGGLSTGSTSYNSRGKGIYSGVSGSQNDSTHIKERKHEAYAALRLVNRDGDVIWSTTQESLGAKFRGAGAEVAAKIAKQLSVDLEKARHPAPVHTSSPAPDSAPKP